MNRRRRDRRQTNVRKILDTLKSREEASMSIKRVNMDWQLRCATLPASYPCNYTQKEAICHQQH